MQNDEAVSFLGLWIFVTIVVVGLVLILLMPPDIPSAVPRIVVASGPGAGTDITAEFHNASADSGRECTAQDRYSTYTRYTCLNNISQDITDAERGRGATSAAEEYFGYEFIYDNQTFDLDLNKLYLIEGDVQVGYCHGKGKITSVKKIADYCDECTQEPGGVRLMGCCAKAGCT